MSNVTPTKISWISQRSMMTGMVVSTSSAWSGDILGSVSSPGNVLTVAVQRATDGRLAYTVSRHGKEVIARSRLGFVLANGAPLDAGFSLAHKDISEHDDTWEQPWGERRFVRNHYRQLRLDVVQRGADTRALAIVFRVFDDGIGFRYELAAQKQWRHVQISDELTEFAVAAPARAWWQRAGCAWALGGPVQKSALGEVGLATTPLTVRTDDGLHIALHEAALVDYASMRLRPVDGQTLRVQLAPSSRGPAVECSGPCTTPWRTLQIADGAAGLYMSDLILNLNEPNALGDVAWVTPSKYVGIWWEMQPRRGSRKPRGATTANAKRHIDFAARHGFRGVLVKGWHLGRDGQWDGAGTPFDVTCAYPGIDLAAVSAYARSKDVRLIGQHESGGDIANYEPQMADACRFFAQLGVDTLQSGYVTDAGAARFRRAGARTGYTDSQDGVRHYLKAVRQAARFRIAINTQEPVKDTGLRRTYPNWLSREGAGSARDHAVNGVEHEADLVFTRMLAGPMDYTAGVLGLEGADGKAFNSTQAKQLANLVVIYSPLVMAADLPQNYARYPAAFKFIRDVPSDWADTRVVHGAVGEYATIARKDRHSGDWYVGSVTDGNARTLALALDFLDAGVAYEAEIYRDGELADYRNAHRFDLHVDHKVLGAGDTLLLRLAPGGGQAIRLSPRQ